MQPSRTFCSQFTSKSSRFTLRLILIQTHAKISFLAKFACNRRCSTREPVKPSPKIDCLSRQNVIAGLPLPPMKVFFFSAHSYDRESFNTVPKPDDFTLVYHSASLSSQNASIAKGYDAICIFVNDICNSEVIHILHEHGVRAILLRCAGFNNIDLNAAKELGLFVARVPGILFHCHCS